MRTLGCLLLLCSALALPAEARTLMGPSVRVALAHGREWGVGLRSDGRGWRLSLGGAAGVTAVVLVDETASTHDKWVLTPQRGALLLDAGRFQPGHAYRVEVRRGSTVVERGLIYLYPSSSGGRGGRSTRVEFEADAGDLSAPVDEDMIRVQPKSAL